MMAYGGGGGVGLWLGQSRLSCVTRFDVFVDVHRGNGKYNVTAHGVYILYLWSSFALELYLFSRIYILYLYTVLYRKRVKNHTNKQHVR